MQNPQMDVASVDLMDVDAFTPYKREYKVKMQGHVESIYMDTEFKEDVGGIESVARLTTELSAMDVNHPQKGESKFKAETVS